ncbi:MAG: glycosyltransferase [Pseudomonadota bacterium]
MPNLANFKRVFIFDPCFGGMTGHWENYCKRLYNELKDRDYSVKVFGQKIFNKQIVDNLNFQPVFQYSPFVHMSSIANFQQQSQLFLEDFNSINDNEFQDGDLLIFHSIFPQILAAIVQWTRQLITKKKVISTIFFQFPPSESKHQVGLLRKIYHALKKPAANNRPSTKNMDWLETKYVHLYWESVPALKELVANRSHHLFTSTDILTKNFSALLDNEVHYLPMPGEKLSPLSPLNVSKTEEGYPIIKIGYLGHSSLEKGGQFLRYIVQKTLLIYPQARFVLHINPNKDTGEYLNFFNQVSLPNVTCYHGHIEQQQMMDLIREIDIVLMPYSPVKYGTTPSAMFTEGMPLQKIFVIPEGTWIHEEAKKYSSGFVSFKKYTHTAILRSLIVSIIDFYKLKQKSIIAAEKFYKENNIVNYVDMFETILTEKVSIS